MDSTKPQIDVMVADASWTLSGKPPNYAVQELQNAHTNM